MSDAAEKVTVAPLMNRRPEIVSVWFTAPWGKVAGLTPVVAGTSITDQQLLQAPDPTLGTVTVTVLAPSTAVGVVETSAISLAELMKVTDDTVTSALPKLTVAVRVNPEPLMTTSW